MGRGAGIKNDWANLPSWPDSIPTEYLFRTSGLVPTMPQEGRLVRQRDAHDPLRFLGWETQEYDTLIHDPWRPVPALGGHATFLAGPKNRVALDERTDILTYNTDTFREHTIFAGDITVELYCKCNSPSFDICAVLSNVYPNGQVYGMTQGYKRVTVPLSTAESSSEPFKVSIMLQSTCLGIEQGHALRLSLSGACYPAYGMNPGTGSPPGQGNLIDAQVITIEIYASEQYPSKLILPIADPIEGSLM